MGTIRTFNPHHPGGSVDYTQPDLFTNHEGLVVDLNKLRRDCAADPIMNEIVQKCGRVTDTLLWHWIYFTNWGTERSANSWLLFSNPQLYSPCAARLEKLKPNKAKPRVLVCGTGSELRGGSHDQNRKKELERIARRQGIKKPSFDYVTHVMDYWSTLFGFGLDYSEANDYLALAKDVPSLIIATGRIRANSLAGLTIDIDDRTFEDHAAFWEIPVVFVNWQWDDFHPCRAQRQQRLPT